MKIIDELSELYKDREREILVLEKEDEKKIRKLLKEKEEKNKQLEIALSNFPKCFKCTIANLNKAIQDKLEIESCINRYFNEKSYIFGFTDAMKFIVQLIEENNDN